MLATLRQCPEFGEITLNLEFTTDVNWFINYLAGTNSVFIMDQDHRSPIHVYVDTCTTGCRAVCQAEAYHSESPASILQENHPICELEAINAIGRSNAGFPNSQHRKWYCIATALWQ